MNRLLILLIIFTSSCSDGNYTNVEIKGKVSDFYSDAPIINAPILITYWVYDLSKWESLAFEKRTLSDREGKFSFTLEKAEAIDLSIELDDYFRYKTSITLKSNVVTPNIKLRSKESIIQQ